MNIPSKEMNNKYLYTKVDNDINKTDIIKSDILRWFKIDDDIKDLSKK